MASTLTTDQRALIRKAIETWVADQDPATANEPVGQYESSDGVSNIYVGNSGTGTIWLDKTADCGGKFGSSQ